MKQTQVQLSVIARAPFNVYYEGEAEAVTATNKVGQFDILPGHADFFSVLSPGEVIITPPADAESMSFDISNGIITVRDNEVLLFVNM
jgi:F-type H+-transporting ATPase subunit epsilon